jgi:hypothetical protein
MCPLLFQISTRTRICRRQIFGNLPNTQFGGNPLRRSQVVTCERVDGRTVTATGTTEIRTGLKQPFKCKKLHSTPTLTQTARPVSSASSAAPCIWSNLRHKTLKKYPISKIPTISQQLTFRITGNSPAVSTTLLGNVYRLQWFAPSSTTKVCYSFTPNQTARLNTITNKTYFTRFTF